MSDSSPERLESSTILTGTIHGSHIITTHTVREMKAYAIYEVELESLSIFNWLTGVTFSAGTAFLSFMLAVYVDVAKEPSSVTNPEVPAFVYGACSVLTVACY